MSQAAAALRVVEKDGMDKNKALDAALTQIERAFGKGSVMRMGSREVVEVDTISTGSLGLDVALASAACRAAGSSRSTGRKARARPRSPSR